MGCKGGCGKSKISVSRTVYLTLQPQDLDDLEPIVTKGKWARYVKNNIKTAWKMVESGEIKLPEWKKTVKNLLITNKIAKKKR